MTQLINPKNFSLTNTVKKQINKVEQRIFEANFSLEPISSFDSFEKDSLLLDLLMKWKIYSGISNQPSAPDYLIIQNFLKKNYPTINLEDIEICIDLITSNQLEIKKGSSDESFANFSCTFVGRCMSAYVKYKKELIFDVKQKLQKEQLELPLPKKTIEERIIEKKDFIKWAYNQIKENPNNFDDLNNMLFNFIYYNQFLDFTEDLKNESISAATIKLKSQQISKKDSLQQAIFSLEKINNKLTNYTQTDVIKEASNYIVKKFFSSLDSIDDFLDKITIEHVKKVEEI